MKYLMAIDAGTGSVRAVVFDTNGTQVGVAQKEWTHREDPRWPGSMDFDWKHNWDLARGCVREVLASTGVDPADVAAVSTTCMREGILLYDADGNEIWACANVDARSNDEVAQLIEKDPGLERELYLESGQTYALGALPRLLWVKNKMPEVYERAATLGMFNDWLIYHLTGVLAVEPSNGSTTGIMSLEKRDWDPSISERCGLRSDLFKPVLECGSLAGHVSAQGASDTGLAEGTPVVVGGGDCQLGMIGVDACLPGQAGVFGGSFWQYEFNTASPKTDDHCRVRVNCHAVPGVWQYEALAFKPGLVMRWFRDAFCQEEKRIAAESGTSAYDLMDERAAEVPVGAGGMVCCFSDIMNFIHWTHAAPTFTNFELDPDKYNKYTFYRADPREHSPSRQGPHRAGARVHGQRTRRAGLCRWCLLQRPLGSDCERRYQQARARACGKGGNSPGRRHYRRLRRWHLPQHRRGRTPGGEDREDLHARRSKPRHVREALRDVAQGLRRPAWPERAGHHKEHVERARHQVDPCPRGRRTRAAAAPAAGPCRRTTTHNRKD